MGGQLSTKTIAHLLEKDRINRDARVRYAEHANELCRSLRNNVGFEKSLDPISDIPHLAKEQLELLYKSSLKFYL